MKEKIRNTQKGITLVALVITIIVMLLLSVVSINIMQNAGIIEKVKLAKEEHRASTIQEQKELFEKEIEISKYEGNTPKTINDLLNKLEEQKLISEEEKNTIMQTGRITIGSKKIIFDTIILPEGYTRCEYLESTGTQYIDTNIKGSNSISVYIRAMTSSEFQQTNLIGARTAYGINQFQIVSYGNKHGKKPQIRYNEYSGSEEKGDIYADEFYTYFANGISRTLTIDDIVVDIATQQELFETEYTMSLFGVNTDGNVETLNAIIKVKCCKIYNEGELILNLIPVTCENDNLACMYDTVTGQTFYNQGTGEFIAGPVVE